MSELQDTKTIREFMEAFGQDTRTVPLDQPSQELRLLRGRLVLEEAFELAAALGLKISTNPLLEPEQVDPKKVQVEIDENLEYDQLETADALADIVVVTKGSALALGVPVDAIIVDEVGPANMAKLNPETGKPILREDGKILKPEGWEPPNIARALDKVRATEE